MHSSKLGNSITTSGELSSELSDLFVRKSRPANLLAMQLMITSLPLAVLHVIKVCAGKEMSGIDARWIVAFVQNIHARGDRAVMKLIGKAMGGNLQTAVHDLKRQNAIAKAVVVARPGPAFIIAALFYAFPKAIFDCFSWPDIVLMADDKSSGFALDVAPLRVCQFRNRRKSAAAAFAQFGVWKFGLGRLWGMLHGIDFLLLGIGQAWGVSSAARHFVLGSTRSY